MSAVLILVESVIKLVCFIYSFITINEYIKQYKINQLTSSHETTD